MYDNHSVGRTLSRDRESHQQRHVLLTPALAREMRERHEGQQGQVTHRVNCRKASDHGGHAMSITLNKARQQYYQAGDSLCNGCRHRTACASAI